MGCLIVASLNSQGGGVDADLDGCGPIGVHLSVLVMIALKLQLQIRSVGHKEKVKKWLPETDLKLTFFVTDMTKKKLHQ